MSFPGPDIPGFDPVGWHTQSFLEVHPRRQDDWIRENLAMRLILYLERTLTQDTQRKQQTKSRRGENFIGFRRSVLVSL